MNDLPILSLYQVELGFYEVYNLELMIAQDFLQLFYRKYLKK